jgi:hypothetical protein
MVKTASKRLWGIASVIPAKARIYRKFYKTFKEAQERGEAKECFATKFFDVADQYGFDQDQQMFVVGSLIEAGNSISALLIQAPIPPAIKIISSWPTLRMTPLGLLKSELN